MDRLDDLTKFKFGFDELALEQFLNCGSLRNYKKKEIYG